MADPALNVFSSLLTSYLSSFYKSLHCSGISKCSEVGVSN